MLDATDQAITLCWNREDGVAVEEVQMKEFDGGEAVEGKGGSEADSVSDLKEWKTLTSTLASSAIRKNKLLPGTAYVFRRRSKAVRPP